MKEKIQEFKGYWAGHYPHVEMAMDDDIIGEYIVEYQPIRLAVNMGVDYVISQGLGEVQE